MYVARNETEQRKPLAPAQRSLSKDERLLNKSCVVRAGTVMDPRPKTLKRRRLVFITIPRTRERRRRRQTALEGSRHGGVDREPCHRDQARLELIRSLVAVTGTTTRIFICPDACRNSRRSHASIIHNWSCLYNDVDTWLAVDAETKISSSSISTILQAPAVAICNTKFVATSPRQVRQVIPFRIQSDSRPPGRL